MHLDLSNCNLLTDASLEALAKYKNNLYSLYLNECHLLTPEGLAKIFNSCNNLEVLQLENIELNKDSFKNTCFRLNYLNLLNNSYFQNQLLEDLKLENLTTLLLDCSNITNEHFLKFGKKCTHLSYLHLENMDNIFDCGILNIIKNNPHLETLILKNGKNITNAALKNYKNLTLYIENCSKITKKDFSIP